MAFFQCIRKTIFSLEILRARRVQNILYAQLCNYLLSSAKITQRDSYYVMRGEGGTPGTDGRGEIGSRRNSGPERSRVFLKSACLCNERTARGTASERVCAACHGAKLIQVHSSSLTLRVSLSAPLTRRSPASSCLTIRKQWRGSTFKDCRCWAAHDNYHRARTGTSERDRRAR